MPYLNACICASIFISSSNSFESLSVFRNEIDVVSTVGRPTKIVPTIGGEPTTFRLAGKGSIKLTFVMQVLDDFEYVLSIIYAVWKISVHASDLNVKHNLSVLFPIVIFPIVTAINTVKSAIVSAHSQCINVLL